MSIGTPLDLHWNVDAGDDITDNRFAAAGLARGLRHTRVATFPIGFWNLSDLTALGATVELSSGRRRNLQVLLGFEHDAIGELQSGGGMARFRAAAASPELAEQLCDRVTKALHDADIPKEETRVPIHFWTNSRHGPHPMRMKIEAPTWTEIADNYPLSIRDALTQIMQSSRTDIEGVALWRGEPGTGKTTALRALAHSWREWCDIHVIIDPEVFLGEHASYLMEVLFSFQNLHTMPMGAMLAAGAEEFDMPPEMMAAQIAAMSGAYGGSFHMQDDDDGSDDEGGYFARMRSQSMQSRAKLIVLEDAGELVSSDARASSGQALSRLLNITDGIIGQGANLSVLVTTNEPIERLHPAIQRPGRCWAQIEFPPFTEREAGEWMREHGVEHDLDGAATLAQLYSWKRGDHLIRLDSIAPDGVGS